MTAACFMWKVKYVGAGTADFGSSLSRIVTPPANVLQTEEPLTVPCTRGNLIGSADGPLVLKQADIAIVTYFRPWPFTFLRCHRLFRFVARFGDDGKFVAWDAEPSIELEPDFDRFVTGWEQSDDGKAPL